MKEEGRLDGKSTLLSHEQHYIPAEGGLEAGEVPSYTEAVLTSYASGSLIACIQQACVSTQITYKQMYC